MAAEVYLLNEKRDSSWSKTVRDPENFRILDPDAREIDQAEYLAHQEKKREERQQASESAAETKARQRVADVTELVKLGLSVGAAERLFGVVIDRPEPEPTNPEEG